MEHTEAMRRARVDGMLPYMYAGWTRTRRGGAVWKGGFAQPVSACWHSALSPVLASLDIFDANYVVGQQVSTDLYLINDSWHDAEIEIDVVLTQTCPEFIPEADCFDSPLFQQSIKAALPADTLRKMRITWNVPDEEGSFWLTARTRGLDGRPVLSQRFVRAVPTPRIPIAARDRTYVVLGEDARSAEFFRDQGLETTSRLVDLSPEKHVVLVWKAAGVTDAQRQSADELCRFASAGGRVVVLAATTWNWPQLCEVAITRTSGSRVFPYRSESHPLLRGIRPDCWKRWNGLPGTVAKASIEGPAVEAGQKILWVREPKHTVVAEVPAAAGNGTVRFAQLDLRSRVLASQPNYDPVAEQILWNLLTE